MVNFIKKIYICLFEPRKIGMFLHEKIKVSILQLLLVSLIAILPYTISMVVTDEISNSSYKIVEKWVMEDSVDLDLEIKNGILSGSEDYTLLMNEAILYINPNDKELELSIDYVLFQVIEFNKESVKTKLFGNTISEKTYKELGITELDFVKIMENDYIEFDRFISIVNDSFKSMKVGWIISNTLFALLEVFLTIVISAFFLAAVVKMFNPIVSYRFRFKAALDGQFISLLFIMFMLLFNTEFLRFVGIIFSAIYVIKAMLTIVRIEVRKKDFQDKEGEDK